MIRYLPCTVLLVSLAAFPTHAQDVRHPPAVSPEGAALLPLAAQARRVGLLGAVEVYGLAVYAPTLDRARLASADVPKALRIEIAHEEDIRRRIALDWRRELVPRVETPATAHLRGSFASLMYRDVVLIEYAPGRGTAVRVNKVVAVSGANHDLMLAFLDHWLGQHPVSEEIKRALLGWS